jgi:hypothetical protein
MSNLNIEDGANITKIIWNGTDYVKTDEIDAIANFKAAAGL